MRTVDKKEYIKLHRKSQDRVPWISHQIIIVLSKYNKIPISIPIELQTFVWYVSHGHVLATVLMHKIVTVYKLTNKLINKLLSKNTGAQMCHLQ